MSETAEKRRQGGRGAGGRGRTGGRAGAAERRGSAFPQMPWVPPVNRDAFIEPLDEAGVEAIHDGAMRILEEIGIEFLNGEAAGILREAGCTVEDTNVRMGRDFVMEMVARAPAEFTITPRNPDRAITIGGRHMVFVNVSSPPNYWDLETGKVPGTRAQCQDLLRLTQTFNCIHVAGGYPVEPVDVHAGVRHLDVLFDKLTLTDKVAHAYSLGRERVEDVMEMVRIAGGLSHEAFEASPRMYTNINSTSPLKHDVPMLDGALRCVRRNQGLIVTPFTLAGAMAPVTMAGAVAQSVAEALCAIALAQWVRPGAACAIGTFTSNVDMRSGAPAFGTPEYMRATQMTGQLARRYGLPLRASGVCAANVPDGQAMWETSNSLWSAVQAGANVVYHAAGWLEGGADREPREVRDGLRDAPDRAALHGPRDHRHGARGHRARRHPRGRLGRPLLRRAAHAGPLRHRLPPALRERLAQPRGLGAGRRRVDGRARARRLQAHRGRVRAAAHGRGRPRGAHGLR